MLGICDMDVQEETQYVMRELIKLLKTQTAIAKELHISRQRFNYWLNHAKKLPHKEFTAMQELLRCELEKQQVFATAEKQNKEEIIKASVIQAIYCNSHLLLAEKIAQLPLRTALLGLLVQSMPSGYFLWEPLLLKEAIFPYLAINFKNVLETLQRGNFIKNVTRINNGMGE